DNLGIVTNDYDGVKNIALLGIDSREDSEIGRADAVLVLSVDKNNNKIKLTSIARDSYMEIEGHGADKLTHAYAYGRSELTVKTLNQNLSLEINDYVMVNFYGFSHIIDYVGGVTVEVDDKELRELNRNIMPYTAKEMGVESQPVSNAGVQKLNGLQALCYARIRHIDDDIERGNRQKEVLSALLSSVKNINPLNLPELAKMIMAECKTSLKPDDIMSMGIWAVIRSPELVQHSLPNDDIKAEGKTVGGKWVYYYDLDVAKENLKKFILEK
ncbi:MAG: LCP family protein, partial [Clostridia bacterium]|nr:LCP family protein [Clostridia bacterium]